MLTATVKVVKDPVLEVVGAINDYVVLFAGKSGEKSSSAERNYLSPCYCPDEASPGAPGQNIMFEKG